MVGGLLTHAGMVPHLVPRVPSASEVAVPPDWTPPAPEACGSALRCAVRTFVPAISQGMFWNPNRAPLFPAEILTEATFSFLGALAPAAGAGGGRRREDLEGILRPRFLC